MVPYHPQVIINGDTCTICGDVVIGLPIPYVTVGEKPGDEERREIREEVHLTPAREIYKQNRNTEYHFIAALYEEFSFQFHNSKSRQTKMQAWQFVKACAKILKEKNRWYSWQDFKPGSQAWKEWWKAHPEDQEDMLAYKVSRQLAIDDRTAKAQAMMAHGVAPEDARKAVNSGLY
jgi:hypothetical protein